MTGKALSEWDQLDQETTERILKALSETDYQIRRAKRNLRLKVRTIIARHREQVLSAAEPPKIGRVKKPVDYAELEAILHRQPITYDIIKRLTGLNDGGVAEVITTLSLRYPLWDPAKGIYELLR